MSERNERSGRDRTDPGMHEEPGAVSPELDLMVCDLIERLLDGLAVGVDPGVVVRIEDASGAHRELAFSDDGEEACLEAAKRYVSRHAAGPPESERTDELGAIVRYAIGYTGCVEIDRSFHDALLVSFFESGMPSGFSAYVLYRRPGSGADFSWSDPEPAGAEPPLI